MLSTLNMVVVNGRYSVYIFLITDASEAQFKEQIVGGANLSSFYVFMLCLKVSLHAMKFMGENICQTIRNTVY